MQSARVLMTFLFRAVIVGLAIAFLLVWWKPALLGAATSRQGGAAALQSAAVNPPGVVTPGGAAPGMAAPGAAAARTLVLPSFADAVARAAPAVVNIYTARVVTERTQTAPLDQLFGDYWPSYRQRIERSLGSGVIVDAAGTIVTNQHVIAGADSIRVQLADGRIAEATITGQDPDTDIAILHLSIGKLPIMPVGRSDTLRVGDIVLAIGNPYGLSQTVTQGIVSATGRGQLGLATFENFIQTDAAINLGNSGGALIDANGDLVGINTAVLNRASGGPEGIGFAIPVNLVRGVMEQILSKGHVVRGWLGFMPQDLSPEQSAQLGIGADGGVTVVNILVKSPAFEAGVRPGDLITGLNGEAVKSAQDLVSRVAALTPGASVELDGRHGRGPFKIKLTVIERPTRQMQR
ncbi:MAG TPA: trypsin-like peptidase domain-containing protein [Steroidobacteraceae bacterium]|nr:trypsin-like peptidase domain-containing protein [Steroidobacteraceae bacterium]